jgi:phosphoglycerol geranylgeranyltransferase
MVSAVRKQYKGFLIVGGGIRDANTARELVKAGADALVIGTMLEKEKGSLKKLAEIANSIKNLRK